MALYEDLASIDLIGPAERAMRAGDIPYPSCDGRVHLDNVVFPERYWVDVQFDLSRRCEVWSPIYFKVYGIIPIGCRNCWKISARPRTLKELFEVSDIQHRTNRNSKSGVEMRPHTGNQGGYSSFWYAPLDGGLEGGRELYKLVKEDLKDTDLKPVLKRGCTEMEIGKPPSSDWDDFAKNEKWDLKEDLLNAFYVFGEQVQVSHTVFKVHSLLAWIKYARAHGDPTVGEYIDEDEHKVKKLEAYHQGGKFSNMNFKSTWREPNEAHNNGHEDANDGEVSSTEERATGSDTDDGGMEGKITQIRGMETT